MIYCGDCGVVPVLETDLPVVLPRDVTITGTGESALAENSDFVNTTCPECGGTRLDGARVERITLGWLS